MIGWFVSKNITIITCTEDIKAWSNNNKRKSARLAGLMHKTAQNQYFISWAKTYTVKSDWLILANQIQPAWLCNSIKIISQKYQNVKLKLHSNFFSDEKTSKNGFSRLKNFLVSIRSANKFICLKFQLKCGTILFEFEWINCESDSPLLIWNQESWRNTEFGPFRA